MQSWHGSKLVPKLMLLSHILTDHAGMKWRNKTIGLGKGIKFLSNVSILSIYVNCRFLYTTTLPFHLDSANSCGLSFYWGSQESISLHQCRLGGRLTWLCRDHGPRKAQEATIYTTITGKKWGKFNENEIYVVSKSLNVFGEMYRNMWRAPYDYIMTHVNNYNNCWIQISNFFAVSGKVMVPAVRSWPKIREAGVVTVGWTIMDRQEENRYIDITGEILLSRGRGLKRESTQHARNIQV